MSRVKRDGTVFGAAFVFALGLYGFSAPADLPCTVSVLAASAAAGFVGMVADRTFGWRVGLAAVLVWTTAPGVWNRAVTGAVEMREACLAAAAIWLAHVTFLALTRRVRSFRRHVVTGLEGVTAHTTARRRAATNRLGARLALGAAAAFALVSAAMHDYRLGEAAYVYARSILDESGDRLVVLNGVADAQLVRMEAKRLAKAGEPASASRLLQFRTDAPYLAWLSARVRTLWPDETNLWAAARIGTSALAGELFASHPDRVYVMTGRSTTPAEWEARWRKVKPYLGSRDGSVPRIRRAFALEGDTLGNRLQAAGRPHEAWALYLRILDEIDPHDASAFLNLDGMMRRGYRADHATCRRVEHGLLELAREERLPELPFTLRTLVTWNNEMIRAYGRGDLATAAEIARRILSEPEWRAFVPANAVMGSVLSREGDCAAAEVFFKAALSGRGPAAPQPVVMNDYAAMLRRLGRLDEAERYARLAARTDIKETDT